MFSLDITNKKLISDNLPVIDQFVDPNTRPGLVPANLVIHTSGWTLLQNTINDYMANAKSMHLLIERSGTQVAQLADFDRVAFHANEYDPTSLGIELIYPRALTEKQGFPNSKDRYDPQEVLFARAENDHRKRWWSLFPEEQLDGLLEITRLLEPAFGLERILAYDEINAARLDTGPAFPINRLRQLVRGEGVDQDSTEETATEADIFLQPGGSGLKASELPLPAGTPIAVTDEDGEWVLVEVMTMVDDRRWLVGWIEANKVAVKPFLPHVSADHLLVTEDNRQIKFLSPYEKNFNPDLKLKPRYVVIHFTTGTTISSTINWFRSPASGVSAHLLIGRNGRVVQFVPFNQVAFHCGDSTWEGEQFLNPFAIGIEVDNAGYLKTTPGGFMRRETRIPDEQVRRRRHWKEGGVRPWQTFTPQQIQVVIDIVRALRMAYPTITEILGHDMINLKNRTDPGPLYPLGELREAILGRPQLEIKAHRVIQVCPIYENIGFKIPNLNHPKFGVLPPSTVRVREVHDPWSKVIVKANNKNKFLNREGWVLTKSVATVGEKARTKFEQIFYEIIPAVEPRLPPLGLEIGSLPVGDQVRVQIERVQEGWVLVAPVLEEREVTSAVDADGKPMEVKYEVVVPAEKVKKYYREGWVEARFLNKVIQ